MSKNAKNKPTSKGGGAFIAKKAARIGKKSGHASILKKARSGEVAKTSAVLVNGGETLMSRSSATGRDIVRAAEFAPARVKDNVVTMPRADFDAWLDRIEDLEDRLALARAGEEESFPVDVLDRLLAGENPVRVFREYRGMKAVELAETCDITKGYLSLIENSKKTPGVDVYRKLADALDLDIDDLV